MKNKTLPVLFSVFFSLCGIAQNSTTITISHVPQRTPAIFHVVEYGHDDTTTVMHQPDTNMVHEFAEVMPELPGGLQNYMVNNIKYPVTERDAYKQGTVYISFIIEKDGTVSNIKERKGVPGAPGLTEEAIRVISSMPKWKPGTTNGKPVRVQLTQPVKFSIGKK